MALRAAYRPLPSTPAHSPHGSVASSRSRTPGQLSLHDYRRQQACPSPGPAAGQKTVKRKVALPSFHDPRGLPTAPPTPPLCEEDSYGSADESDEDDDAAIDRFLSSVRARREALRRASGLKGSRMDAGLGLEGQHGLTATVSAAWGSISPAPPALNSAVHRPANPLAEFVPMKVQLELSPPPSPATPLLGYHNTTSSPSLTLSSPPSRLRHSGLRKVASFQPRQGLPRICEPQFKPIKRLPRPPRQYSPLVPSPLSSNPPSLTHTSSSYSPFSLSKDNFPNHPASESLPTPAWPLPDPGLSFKAAERDHDSVSLSELLHLYGSSFELLNRHDSLAGAHISASSSEPGSPGVSLLPSLLPAMSNPFRDQDHPSNQGVRDSIYSVDFDGRSIAPESQDVPLGILQGITDYTDLVRGYDGYSPVADQVLGQYGRANMPIAQQSIGRPPTSPLPPLPQTAAPRARLPLEQSSLLERTTTYGDTQLLLRDQSSVGLEIGRSAHAPQDAPAPLFSSSLSPRRRLDPSELSLPQFADSFPETASLAPSHMTAGSEEWKTTSENSLADLQNMHTIGEGFPFATHIIPPLRSGHVRRGLNYEESPDVPSPQSTIPESVEDQDTSPRALTRTRTEVADSSLPVASSVYPPADAIAAAQAAVKEPESEPLRPFRMHPIRPNRTFSGSYYGPAAVDPALLSSEPPDDIHSIRSSIATQIFPPASAPRAHPTTGQLEPGRGPSTTPAGSTSTPLRQLLSTPIFRRPTLSANRHDEIDGITPAGIELRSLAERHLRAAGPGLDGFSAAETYSAPPLQPELVDDAATASRDSLDMNTTSPLSRSVAPTTSNQNTPTPTPQRPAPIYLRPASAGSSVRPLFDHRRSRPAHLFNAPRNMDGSNNYNGNAEVPGGGMPTRPMSPRLRPVLPAHATSSLATNPYYMNQGSDSITALPQAGGSMATAEGSAPLRHERFTHLQHGQHHHGDSENPEVVRAARIWLGVCTLLPPLLPLYAAGALDPLLSCAGASDGGEGEGAGRGKAARMPRRYRLAAAFLCLGEVLVLLLVLAVWGVTRSGH